jgi:methyl-accepting chemotaxis protein
MAHSKAKSGIFNSPWATLARIVFTGIFFFWLYWIATSTSDLSDKINAATNRLTTLDSLQVDYKDEIQEWKNVLLRSDDREMLNQNWQIYEKHYQQVATSAQEIIAQNDVRAIGEKMKSFVEAHAANHEKYKNSVLLLIKNKYSPSPSDAAVKGIDQPLLDVLTSANVDMKDERERTNESLIASTRNKIEQSLFALAFIGLLAIWMPKH